MDSIEFVNRYDHYLSEIRDVIKPELFPQLDELAQIDPHDLVSPETWFPDENSARGLIWSIFVRKVKALKCLMTNKAGTLEELDQEEL